MSELIAKVDKIENLCQVLYNINLKIESLKDEIKSSSKGLNWDDREFRNRKDELDKITEVFDSIYDEFSEKIEKIILYRASLEKVEAKTWEELIDNNEYIASMSGSSSSSGDVLDMFENYAPLEVEGKEGEKKYTLSEVDEGKSRKDEIEEWTEKLRLNAGTFDLERGISQACGDPINAATGNFIMRKSDLIIEGFKPIEFARFYNSIDSWKGALGKGWHHKYEIFLEIKKDSCNVIYDDGRLEKYNKIENEYKALHDNGNKLKELQDGFYILLLKDHSKMMFNEKGQLDVLMDFSKNLTRLHYEKDKLVKVENVCGYIELEYENGLISKVTDHTGRNINYEYDNLKRLIKFKDVDKFEYEYKYNEKDKIIQIKDTKGIIKLKNKYDKFGRTIKQKLADGTECLLDYNDKDSSTYFVERNGTNIKYIKDNKNRIIETVYSDGKEKIVIDNKNNVTKYTDKNGNTYEYIYYDNGNVKTEINPIGHEKTYEYNEFDKITKIIKSDGSVYNYNYNKNGNLIEAIDSLNRKTKMEYNKKGLVKKIIRPDETTIIFKHDKKGNIIEIVDACGNISKFDYDELNRGTAVIRPEGNKISYNYTNKGKITSVKMPDGNRIERKYDKRNLLIEEKDVDGLTTYYKYDDMENLIEVKYPGERIKKLEYNKMGKVIREIRFDCSFTQYKYDLFGNVSEVIDPDGYKIKYKYDKVGNLVEIINRKGNISKFKYDELNRLIEKENAKNKKIKYSYDLNGNLTTVLNALDYKFSNKYDSESQLIGSTNSEGHKIEYKYDLMGRIKSVKNPKGGVITYEYDNNGNIIKVTNPDNTIKKYEYNKNNKLVKYINAEGSTIYYTYDLMERLINIINTEGNSKLFEYNGKGQIIKVVDENKNATNYKYDFSGNLVEVIDSNGHSTKYSYDILGNLTQVHRYGEISNDTIERMYDGVNIDKPSNEYITKYTYNNKKQVTKEINPSGFVTEYKYDEEGNLISKTDREGFNTTYEYDSLNNLKKIKYSDDKQINIEYDDLNRMVSMIDWLGENKFELDSIGRIKKMKDYKNRVLEYGWSSTNEKEYLVYPDGTKVNYKYDLTGRIKEVSVNNEISKYEYDSIGRIKKQILPNGIETNYGFTDSKLKSLQSILNGEIIDDRKFKYDIKGNKTHIVVNGENTFYSYDNLNQIIEEKKSENNITKYFYDTLGNRIRIEDWYNSEKPEITEYSYDNNEHLINIIGKRTNLLSNNEFLSQGIQMAYDKRGNLEKILNGSNLIANLTFDETNKLCKVSNSNGRKDEFVYDGFARRVSSSSKEYLCDITKPYNNVLQMNDSKYIYGNGILPICEFLIDENKYYVHDELGSPVKSISNLVLNKKQEFNTFGEINQNNDFFGFTGYQNDETGLVYGQARYYMSETGRFISEDSYKGRINKVQSLNLNVYCSNNPLIFIDPSGNTQCGEYSPYMPPWTDYSDVNQHWYDDAVDYAALKGNQALNVFLDNSYEVSEDIAPFTQATMYAWKFTGIYRAFDYSTQKGWFSGAFDFFGFEREPDGTYHAKQSDSLQSWTYSGYNEFYDAVFHSATSMDRDRFEFSYNGEDYVLWAWKGDYLNLGAGAELGIYRRMDVEGTKSSHWLVDQDLAMPMTLKLDYKGEEVDYYKPDENQWWITSFKPEYDNVNADDLTATYTIDFSGNEGMFDAFYRKHHIRNEWRFDTKNHTATFKL